MSSPHNKKENAMTQLNESGYLKLVQIIGQKGVSAEQAAENKRKGEVLEAAERERQAAELKRQGKDKANAKKWRAHTGPRRARAAVPGLCPMSRSTAYLMMKNGTFPKPVKGICARAVFFSAAAVWEFLSSAGKGERATP
jgi:predicted DNA-binding transcriptional regulator AlpA